MNLKQLEAFVRVADLKSFSKAANKLFLTQPTISAHVAALEKELNVRLFVRNTKDVQLSERGEKLYGYAKQMGDIEKAIEQEFLKKSEDRKCITIAASTVPAQYLLPQILAMFYEKHPKEQFQVIEMDSAKVIKMILNHEVEVGFTGTVFDKKHCKYIPFYEDELVIITPNNEKYNTLLQEKPLEDWIVHEKFIMRGEGSGTRKEAEAQLKKLGVMPSDLDVVASMENQETIKRSVANGVGISVVSKLAVEEEIQEGKVLGISFGDQGKKRELNLVYNKNYQLSCSADKFVKAVKRMYH